jgi:stage III sporulation protein SpoIIIAA
MNSEFSEKNAVNALAKYLLDKSGGGGEFPAAVFGDFYYKYPKYKGVLKKKAVEKFGAALGLKWISNAPKVDVVVFHPVKKLKLTHPKSSTHAPIHSPTVQEAMNLLKRCILDVNDATCPTSSRVSTDNLGTIYDKHPKLMGFINKAHINSTTGVAAGLKWYSEGPKNYIIASRLVNNPTAPVLSTPPACLATSPAYCTEFVDDIMIATLIIEELLTVKELAVDIEGDLSKEGKLSLIQIAAELDDSESTSVYIFDILKCPEIMTDGGLSALLSEEGITKIIHDCRQDSQALLYQHNVSLRGVFDTQVAYSALDTGPNAHRRQGLNVVLEKYAGTRNDHKGEVKHRAGLWEQRPLPANLQSYAAQDVAYMQRAFQAMTLELNRRGALAEVFEKSSLNVAKMRMHENFGEAFSFGAAPPMGLLQDSDVGTVRHVQFGADGTHELSEEPFQSPMAHQPQAIDEYVVDGADLVDLGKLIAILPEHIQKSFYEFPMHEHTTEIVLDVGRRPLVRYVQSDNGAEAMPMCSGELRGLEVSRDDLVCICQSKILGGFSSDNRAGLGSTLHRISRKLNRNDEPIGLTMRIGRMVQGSTSMIADIVASNRSVLLLGIPGVGKTTLLREYARVLASSEKAKRVEIVDTSNEIAGDGDIPHYSVGTARRMMVKNREAQHQIMIEAVQNHTPQCIVVDEIGTSAEAIAAGNIAQRGVQIIATAHGTQLKDLLQSADLCCLLGGVHTVVIGDEEARNRGLRSKSVRERCGPPVFDTVVELRSHHKWVVYHNVVDAVDTILEGKVDPVFEVRSRNVATGDIQVKKTNCFD